MKRLILIASLPAVCLAQTEPLEALPAIPVADSAANALAFELPPVIAASSMLTPLEIQGPDHRVREAVPTDGYMAHFTIDSAYGTFNCIGLQATRTTIQEMAAITTLVNVSKSDLFAEGLKKSIEQPVDAVKHIVADPVESAKQLPKSVGHFFKKVGRSVQNAAEGIKQNAAANGGDASETAMNVGNSTWHAAKGIAGFDSAKLDCAQQLGVDPYSDNERLQEEMEKVAWVFFSGGLPIRAAAMAVSGGASMALTATKFTGLPEEIYTLTPSELKLRNDDAMTALGVPEDLRIQFDIAPVLSLSQKRSIVLSLQAIGTSNGAIDVIQLALSCPGPRQAAFLTQALGTLANRQAAGISSYTALQVIGRTLAATEASGVNHVAAPVDYVTWTSEVAEFAQREEMAPLQPVLLLSGPISDTARAGFIAAGWQVEQQLN